MARHPSLRRTGAVLGALLVASATGCGVAADDSSGSGSGPQAALAEPITVEHQFGTTVVDAVPEQVVTLDLQWTDVMLAMGVEPVGYAIDSYMPDPGVPPWQDLPAGAEGLPTADGLPIERIAELEPDLILGTYLIGDAETYELLTDIAPTIAQLDERQVTPWQELLALGGDLLADPDTAATITASVEEQVATTAAELPGLAGQTFSLSQYIVGDSVYIVADERDGSSIFFQDLGMTMYPPVREEGDRTGDARVQVSTERADLLRADLLVFLVNGGDESDLADIPGFDELPGTVAVLEYADTVALNTPSPLSIPHALEVLDPFLTEAANEGTQ